MRLVEKINEELISIYESQNTLELKDYYVILPINYTNQMYNYFIRKFKGKKGKDNFKYTSETNSIYLNINQLKNHKKNNLSQIKLFFVNF